MNIPKFDKIIDWLYEPSIFIALMILVWLAIRILV